MGKAPYRFVILKQRFPDSTVKTIVRTILISSFLTIIDSDGLEDDSCNLFFMRLYDYHSWMVIGKHPVT